MAALGHFEDPLHKTLKESQSASQGTGYYLDMARTAIPDGIQRAVLIESGYRCAVPTCRGILAIDLHHMEQVSSGGKNDVANLLALCPTCHALYHRGTIPREAIYAWKSMLVSISRAFDVQAIDDLLFLAQLESLYKVMNTYASNSAAEGNCEEAGKMISDTQFYDVLTKTGNTLVLSGDGVLRFARLIGAGLAQFNPLVHHNYIVTYEVILTDKGKMLIDAWKSGERASVENALVSSSQSAALPE